MRWVLWLVVICLYETAQAQVSPVLELPQETVTDIVSRLDAHFHPERLPADSPYHLNHAICGTSALVNVASHWKQLPVATKQSAIVLFQRPTLNESVLSPSGHFKVHFNRTGTHAVSTTDADKNGIPDYVDETMRVFDRVWAFEINQLGYKAPPSDGDNIYDIYIQNLGLQQAYGFTYPIAYPETVTPSYIEIDNDFAENIYQTRGLKGLQVTAAHEFFHAIQFGYYADFGASWWQEMTATWMEDVVYPDINDFYQYVSYFYKDPEASLDKFSGSFHPFGGAVFPHHVEQIYGASAIRKVWETLNTKNPQIYRLSDLDTGMPIGGFGKVLPRFIVWNYLTGSRSRPGYYDEAADFPLVTTPAISLSSGGTFSGTARINYLGTTYLPVKTSGLTGGLRGIFTLGTGGDWTILVMLISDRIELIWPKSTTIVIPDVNKYQEVVFMPMVTSLRGSQVSVSYTLSAGLGNSQASDRVGDFDGNATVNFSDFLAFVTGFGKTHSDAGYNSRLDLNGDGPVDFIDFLIFVSHFGES